MDIPAGFKPIRRASPFNALVGPPKSVVTASLTIDYAVSAKVGDWLEVRTDVLKSGGRLTFANCYVHV